MALDLIISSKPSNHGYELSPIKYTLTLVMYDEKIYIIIFKSCGINNHQCNYFFEDHYSIK